VVVQSKRHAIRSAGGEGMNARRELLASGVYGVVVAVVVGILAAPDIGALVGWIVGAGTYIVVIWRKVWPMNAAQAAPLAEREDPTRATADLILLGATVASLAAVGLELARAGNTSGTDEVLRIALALSTIVVSWVVLHTVFMIRYARMYYAGEDGGIDFNQDEPPDFHDFAYLAFTIGMTYQVSDTTIQSAEIRRAALRHAILSFLFGTGILATSINLVATLSS
jgi:uncharacterized membrane protein